jgi:hypothetical protein
MRRDMWRRLQAVVGAVQGLLLARLVGLLFAVRPGNVVFEVVLAITAPLVWPWGWLDRWAGQPRWGARLELATLATMLTLALVLWAWVSYRTLKRKAGTRSDGAA